MTENNNRKRPRSASRSRADGGDDVTKQQTLFQDYESAESALVPLQIIRTETVLSNPDFAQPTLFMDPRRVMLGVRLNLGR